MSNVVRSAAVRLTMENASYIRGANQSATATEQATGRIQRSVRNTAVSTGRDWDTMGKYGGRTALAIGAGLVFAEKKLVSFDKTMSAASAATRATGQELESLRAAAIKAGADTAFTSTEAAQAIVEEGKAGISTANILKGGLRGALDLAAAGTIGVGEAAEYTATALVQFKLGGDQARHVADLLAAGAGKAQGEVTDMALALSYVGVPAHAAKISLEETVGTIALLAKNGLIGEKAGTSLRGMLASLESPSKIASKVMQKYGIDVFDASGKLKGFDGIAQELHDNLGKLTDEEKQYALGKIFGNEQLQAANILLESGAKGVHKMTTEVNDQGYATETANKKLDNLAGDWERFTGSLEAAVIKAGSPAQGALRDLVQGGEQVVNAFAALPDEVQASIVKFLALTVGIGATLFVISKVRNVVRDLRGFSLGRGGRGAAGGLGGAAASLGSPVPVFVTNLAGGALGGVGGVGAPGAPGAPGTAAGGKGRPVAVGTGIGLPLATLALSSPDVLKPSDRGRTVIDDKFLKDHVVVDGHWYTKAAWAKEQAESDAALKHLLNPDRKGAKKPQPRTSEDVLADLFGVDPKKLKPVPLLDRIIGVLGTNSVPTPGGTHTKNGLRKIIADLGLDTTDFDRDWKAAKKSADILDKVIVAPHLRIVGVPEAMSATVALKRLIDSLHDRNIRIKVTKSTNANLAEAAAVHPAHGGRIVGPGTSTSDSIPAYVSNGEYVMRAAAVDKYGVAMFDRLNSMRFAGGGQVGDFATYSTSPSVIVSFPTPTALAAAVKAANDVATAAVRTAQSAKDIRQQGLDDLHTQQQIRDLQHQMQARNKKGRLELRGLDREAAKAELADAKATLVEIRHQAKAARDEARQAALEEQIQNRKDATEALTSAGDIFARGTSPASAIASVNRTVADIASYGQVMAQLKSAGASPALLQQLMNRANQGDFRSAIRLGKALLSQPGTLGQLNASLAALGSVSSSVATMTTDPRFLGAGAWNPTTTKVVQVNVGLDPSTALQDLRRIITFEVQSALTRATM